MSIVKRMECKDCKKQVQVSKEPKPLPPCPKCAGPMKITDRWAYNFRHQGKRHFKLFSTSKQKTTVEEARIKEMLHTGEYAAYLNKNSPEIDFDYMSELILTNYDLNQRKSKNRTELSISHMKDFFKNKAYREIARTIEQYKSHRNKQGAANATINRELTTLKTMFRLAMRRNQESGLTMPFVDMLKEAQPRSGFLAHHEYNQLKLALPTYLRPILTIAYHTGMRMGEILSLQWNQVNMVEKTILLNKTKNGETRLLYLHGELFDVVKNQKELIDTEYQDCPFVFFRVFTAPRRKKRGAIMWDKLTSFNKAWNTATKKVGLEGLLFHDMRRTGVRNLVRSGVKEKVAMKISGHKTRSVFDRYDITDEDDLKAAAQKVSEFHRLKDEELTNVIPITKS